MTLSFINYTNDPNVPKNLDLSERSVIDRYTDVVLSIIDYISIDTRKKLINYLHFVPEYKEEYDYFICFNGADYIANLVKTDTSRWDSVKMDDDHLKDMTVHEDGTYKSIYKIPCIDSCILDGIYFISTTHTEESHDFVIAVIGSILYVLNTYGGREKIYIGKFYKDIWISRFNNMWHLSTYKEQRDSIEYVYAFDKETYYPSQKTELCNIYMYRLI